MINLEIRELKTNDIQQIVELKQEFNKDQNDRNTFGTHIGNFQLDYYYSQYKKYFITNNKKIFVAVVDDKVVGMIKAIIRKDDPSFEFGEHAHICDLFVLKEYRDYRICIELYLRCKKWIKDQGCKYITAYTFGFNELIKRSMHILGMKEYKVMYVRDISDD